MARALGVLLGAGCFIAAIWVLILYPLPIWPLAIVLAVYAAALWRWPALFLLVIPIVLPAFDLGLWTGWTMVGEADVCVLITLAVLLIRAPPPWSRPGGLADSVILGFAAIMAVAAIIGLTNALGDSGQSANPYLRPDNALRLIKGLAEALALLPFLRARQRQHGDALALLGAGIAAGLIVVTLVVLAERALFAGILDFQSEYRVAGPFASMHVGGGHIGAYVGLALPFAFALLLVRRGFLLPALGAVAALAGSYTLMVTFARTGYVAGAAGCAVTGLGLLIALWRRGGAARVLAVVPVVLLFAAIAAAASMTVMRQRVAIAAADLLTREANWREGWAVRDTDPVTTAFGMGLGTYQRIMLTRASVNRPSDFGISRDGEGPFVWLRAESPLFLGQKVSLPESGSVTLSLRVLADSPRAILAWSLCDKVLLFSDNCQSGQMTPEPGTWRPVTAALPVAGLGAGFGPLRRPVELSLFDARVGTGIEIRDVRLTDSTGRTLLTNGDFAQGLDHWLFTDDSHVSWRILNVYLMLLFEAGAVGLVGYLAWTGVAVAGGVRALVRGDPMGAAVAGALVSFLISGLFDNVLEAPRLSALFFLICLGGLTVWKPPAAQ